MNSNHYLMVRARVPGATSGFIPTRSLLLSNESKRSEPETHFDLIDTDADSGILIQELAVFFTGEARATATRGFPLSISSAKKRGPLGPLFLKQINLVFLLTKTIVGHLKLD